MAIETTKPMFARAMKGHYAIGAFNFDNMDEMRAIMRGAENLKAPIILAVTSGSWEFMDPLYIRTICDCAAKEFPDVEFALHLDHGKSVSLCKQAVDAGFTSVMIDASSKPYDENVADTKEVVEYAHAHGVVVESELGALAGIEDDVKVDDKYGCFTHPSQAVDFVKKTGIDSLAIAIGTSHGAYKFKPGTKPQLRFDILDDIHKLLPDYPIVLHGASSVPTSYIDIVNQYGGKMPYAVGIPEAMLAEAARRGVCKINVATDLRVAYVGAIRKFFAEHPEKFDIRVIFKAAQDAVTTLIESKIKGYLQSEGKAVTK
jgi:fructose-bisphosphate aldolase class II